MLGKCYNYRVCVPYLINRSTKGGFFLSGKVKILREITGWAIAILLPVIIVFTLNLKVFAIPVIDQSSMHNTLIEGDVVYVNRFCDNLSKLKREDIVLFLANGREKQGLIDEIGIKLTDISDKFKKKSNKTNERYIKRIIGMPGDVIDITSEGKVFINGSLENRDYVVGLTPPGDSIYPVLVPEGHLFVMGDNRGISKDSRHFGCISIKSIEGRADIVLWPISKVGNIE